jgi:hypothetical protein
MFFQKKKKEEDLGDQFAVFQERKAPRFASNAGISIEGFEGEGLLKNVSVSGCCLESVTYAAITPNQTYRVKIIPGADEKMEPFNIKLVANWIKSSETLFEAGFSLEESERNPLPKRYVELLQMRGVKPEYGNMSVERRAKS